MSNLKETKLGQTVYVKKIGGDGALRQHFLDMGIIPGTRITPKKYAPGGDPLQISLRGYELTIRISDAEKIEVYPVTDKKTERAGNKPPKKTFHPGLGEGGKFHLKGDGTPLPDDTVLRFALVGNQNCGKTTLFNKLTGSKQHVGNFPGVTVDRKDGTIRNHDKTLVTDLPGIYSMSPYSNEEIVSRNFVFKEKPHAIINIVDVTNIERNLYLTMQLIEMNKPMVIALNMMDELTSNGGSIDVNLMEKLLGVPVVPISAAKGEGIEELVEHAIHVAHYQEKPVHQDFCDKTENGGAVHKCIHSVSHLIEDHADRAGIPIRFASTKVVEGDDMVISALELDDNEKQTIDHIVSQLEKERKLDRSAAIADMRFSFISKLCEQTVTKPKESKEHKRSNKIDKILTGKFTAIPSFILIMLLISFLTFNVIGAFFQDIIEKGVELLTSVTDKALTDAQVNETIHSLIIDGIFEGVGSVLSFLPIILVLFFFLSMLEDSGYLARVAFFMDKSMRKIGLSGRSIVPMLIGFGCSVPAVMATRTLPSERDRKMTILLTPFMSCSAKMAIYAFFVEAFFPDYGWIIYIGLYLTGIIIGILISLIYKKTVFKGEAVPFVMELPNYRFPGARNVFQLLWEKSKDFLQRAFSVILIATVAVWFLQKFDIHMNIAENPENSILAMIASLMTPLMQPVGLDDWRILVSLFTGFMAKESVVSTLEVLYTNGIVNVMTPLTALTLLVFTLLYTPCVAAIASIRRELGTKWAVIVVVWQCVVAWAAALIIRAVGIMIGVG